MTQSPKIQKAKPKEKLIDKEQSERFRETAKLFDLEHTKEIFLEKLDKILSKKN